MYVWPHYWCGVLPLAGKTFGYTLNPVPLAPGISASGQQPQSPDTPPGPSGSWSPAAQGHQGQGNMGRIPEEPSGNLSASNLSESAAFDGGLGAPGRGPSSSIEGSYAAGGGGQQQRAASPEPLQRNPAPTRFGNASDDSISLGGGTSM